MTPRQINLALRISAIAMGVATVPALVAGLAMPVQSPIPRARLATTPGSAAAPTMAALPPLEAFAGVWGQRLRRPLEESRSQPGVAIIAGPVQAVAPAPPPLVLVGTIGTSLALLRSPDGSTVVKAVGETLDGADILSVRLAAVEVRFGGKTLTLKKPTAGSTPQIIFGPTPDVSHESDGPVH